MVQSEFIAYVGVSGIHDGHIRSVASQDERLRVVIEGASGHHFAIEFDGVGWVKSQRPEDMMLYALAEWKAEPPLRRFVFANWDEEDDAYLEIGAEGFRIIELAS